MTVQSYHGDLPQHVADMLNIARRIDSLWQKSTPPTTDALLAVIAAELGGIHHELWRIARAMGRPKP